MFKTEKCHFPFELHLSTPADTFSSSVVMTAHSTKKVQRKAFSPTEDYLLRRLVEIHGDSNWEQISHFLQGRSARACRERWKLSLSPGIVNGPWSREEDALLARRVQEIGPKWKLLSREFRGRSECNIKNRWARHLRDMLSKDPGIFGSPAAPPAPPPAAHQFDLETDAAELIAGFDLFPPPQDCFLADG